jgi:hypothetical protein
MQRPIARTTFVAASTVRLDIDSACNHRLILWKNLMVGVKWRTIMVDLEIAVGSLRRIQIAVAMTTPITTASLRQN